MVSLKLKTRSVIFDLQQDEESVCFHETLSFSCLAFPIRRDQKRRRVETTHRHDFNLTFETLRFGQWHSKKRVPYLEVILDWLS